MKINENVINLTSSCRKRCCLFSLESDTKNYTNKIDVFRKNLWLTLVIYRIYEKKYIKL